MVRILLVLTSRLVCAGSSAGPGVGVDQVSDIHRQAVEHAGLEGGQDNETDGGTRLSEPEPAGSCVVTSPRHRPPYRAHPAQRRCRPQLQGQGNQIRVVSGRWQFRVKRESYGYSGDWGIMF